MNKEREEKHFEKTKNGIQRRKKRGKLVVFSLHRRTRREEHR